AALLFAYVAHFEGEMGIGAHSYFRYNTHLGLLSMAAIVLLLRRWCCSTHRGHWQRAASVLLVLPGDNGSVAPAIEGVLRYTRPRRPDVELHAVPDLAAAVGAMDDRYAL